jgi:hypothetical protein
MTAVDDIILPMRNIDHLQGAIMLCELKVNNSLAIEPKSTQDTTICATWILDAKQNKAALQSIVKDNFKHPSANQQKKLLQLLMKYESLFNGVLRDWRTKQVFFHQKYTKTPSSKRWRSYENWGY